MTTEWPSGLDVGALRTAGLRPMPFRQFVLKAHGRCNLSCTYCYVYHSEDQSWRDKPVRVSDAVMERVADRIAEHAHSHALRAVEINLHGGEPLLTGPGLPVRYVEAVRQRVADATGGRCSVHASLQTNGTLLNRRTLDALAAAKVRVGISLDGGLARHNPRRVDHAGRPAWPAAARGVRLLANYPDLYAGVLSTVDPQAPVEAVYTSLLDLAPPSLEFLLPHATWSSPPPGMRTHPDAPRPTPYGDWLAAAFDLWFDADRPPPRIRLFTDVIALLAGLPAASDAVGTSPMVAVVVETDGTIEQVDSLKTAYHGAAVTGMDVFRHPFDEALNHPGVLARQLGTAALAATCQACPVVAVCGGGNYVHRYRAGEGFLNPSVYCRDLEHLIRHVSRRLRGELREFDYVAGGTSRGGQEPSGIPDQHQARVECVDGADDVVPQCGPGALSQSGAATGDCDAFDRGNPPAGRTPRAHWPSSRS
ncbi:FxsB family cyclophane-forming radical SAM/SPASM peptide maturase [Streptomyces inhibens]|uniref:FxsB family cyclophane-forming radical SAM/SPASM peptide maturase n=1 Tax=Streptomyces inhibens TaxID=2293571 RepID=UPI00367E02F0